MSSDRALWAGLLTGPLTVMTSFLANFALAPAACVWRAKTPLYTISAITIFVTLGAGLFSLKQWTETEPGQGRARLMAAGAIGVSVLSLLIAIGQGAAEAILGACD